jgi:hypothetical protein
MSTSPTTATAPSTPTATSTPPATIVDIPVTEPAAAPPSDPHAAPITAPDGTGNTPESPAVAIRHTPGEGASRGPVRTGTDRSTTLCALLKMREDRGAATAEYVIATMAAVGFAGLLIVILRGDEVRGILTDLVRSALSVG